MPVTARLSRKFYERFGDEIAGEFVDWFNAVDATYRAELRELNEANFARFDAKMGERLAQLDTPNGKLAGPGWMLAVIGTGAGVISLLLRH